MAYDNQTGDKLCLTNEMAKDYFRTQIGETVKLTVTAVLKSAGVCSPDDSEGEDMPYVEFEVLEVEGGKKPYAEMSAGEMDQEIYNVKSEDQTEPDEQSTMPPNIEDGGSVWTDTKRQAKVSRTPARRVRPFGMR